jgi:glycosyltransferase involved in cell wall biosynthesis
MNSVSRGVYIDISTLQGPFFERGIPRYIAELSRAMLAKGADIVGFGLAPELPLPNEAFRDLVEHPLCAFTTPERLARLRSKRDFVVLLTSVFEGFPVETVWRPELVCGPEPVAVLVYDTIPLRYPDLYQATVERQRFYEARVRLLRTADMFFAISQSAADELIEDVGVDPSAVSVIGIGVSERFVPPADLAQAQSVGRQLVNSLAKNRITNEGRRYVLCIGGWTATKNIDRLLEAWALFVDRESEPIDLVLVCRVPDDLRLEWAEKLRQLGIEQSVVVTGRVSDDDLLPLYQGASLFICPSLHEGFGLPLAEAIRCGVVAIGSNVGPIAEQLVSGEAMFDPCDAANISLKLLQTFSTISPGLGWKHVQLDQNRSYQWAKVADIAAGEISLSLSKDRQHAIDPAV